jgi:uncharacterized phage protein (TIGR01671 family)
MNREIKFRFWGNFGELNEEEDICEMEMLYGDKFSFFESEPINNLFASKNFQVMQYTGLKDKNGKEIYDGDILRLPAKSDWDKVNYSCYEVFFHDGDANMDYNIGFSIARMHNHGSVCGGYIPSFKPKTVSHMEVIGNIYEHPELLENKTTP